MVHTVLIVLHALAGTVAFAAGVAATARERWLRTYRRSLVASTGFLVLAIAATATGRDVTNWAVSAGLLGLAAVMVGRAYRAERFRPSLTDGRTARYVHHVGFGVVGLFDAFWVVALMRADVPGAVVGAVAAGIAVAGHFLLARVAARPVARRGRFPASGPGAGAPGVLYR